jgi:hypothetical protein
MIELQDAMLSLQKANDLDLLRLHTAIGHLLRDPVRIMAIRRHLHLGQEVDFWNARTQKTQRGRIVNFKPDQVLVQTELPRQGWWVMYAAISMDPANMPPQPPPERRPTRADFARGDNVSFEPQDMIARFGSIIRMNQKTATVATEDGMEWRVAYGALRRVVNV